VTTLAAIEAALVERGLAPRGAFHPGPDDGAPAGAATIVLAGQVGASHWERFERERRDEPDPLDRWSARALEAIAERFDARVILPGDGPPRPPFQRWAMRAEPVHPSPLGLLIHPEYGLWHAYRGALAFAETIALPPRADATSPCDACADRPCLRSCPVGAFSAAGFDAGACADHLGARGDACFAVACLARAACPVGRAHRYPPPAARFHLEAFVRGVARS
jgi:hypothetical protein